jgi:hypothetical protein
VAKAKQTEPQQEETADAQAPSKKPEKRPRRVFQCMQESHPSMLTVYQRAGYTDDGGQSYGPVTKVLHVNQGGQFVLPEDCEYYDEQLDGLRRASAKIEMVDLSDLKDPKKDGLEEGQPPAQWSSEPTQDQLLIEAQQRIDETSEELTEKNRENAAKDAEIAELKADLAKAQGK